MWSVAGIQNSDELKDFIEKSIEKENPSMERRPCKIHTNKIVTKKNCF